MRLTGAQVLDDVVAFMRRYVIFPNDHQPHAIALWCAHTWAHQVADQTPYLHVSSPEKRSGKSRLLEVIALLVRKPKLAIGASEAALFRLIEEHAPTLLLDEIDTVFAGGKASEHTESLRGLLNAGCRRNATVLRCATRGKTIETVEYHVFCPKVLAGIGAIPDTIADRSIPIRLRRRARGEAVERFRIRKVELETVPISDALEIWMDDIAELLEGAEPDVPDQLSDRQQDAWEALLAIADIAGGHWPHTGRQAAIGLSSASEPTDDTIGVRLLADIRDIFDTDEKVSTEHLLTRLHGIEEAPWGDWYGKPLDSRTLARLLRPYEIKSTKIRLGTDTAKGYRRQDCHDAWSRYLPDPTDTPEAPPTPLPEGEHGEQGEHPSSAATNLFPITPVFPIDEGNTTTPSDPCSRHARGTPPTRGTETVHPTSTVPHVPHVPLRREGPHPASDPPPWEPTLVTTQRDEPAVRIHPCRHCGVNVIADDPDTAYCIHHYPNQGETQCS